jgi:FADH2 O2-dependent halogenase
VLNPGGAEIRFSELAQPGVDKEYTYHVDRGIFDNLLLQHAKKLGASVYEGIKVDEVDFSPRCPALKFKMGRKDCSLNVRMVVDATGRRTLLGNQLKMKIKDPIFDQCACHAWFEDYDRSAGANSAETADYIFIHFLPLSNSWLWQIPITDTITSIGVVTQKRHFPKTKESREKFFWEAVATRPELHDGLKAAKQIRPFKEEGDYSYSMTQIAGDRFIMVGDAGRFVDPIFSTGVSIALNCARFGSQDIIHAVKSGDFSRDSFQKFEKTIRQGTKNWYEFISVYYRLNILFTYFISSKKYRMDVLKLLQGDVYEEEEPAVLKKMRDMVREVEQDEGHMWHKMLLEHTRQ